VARTAKLEPGMVKPLTNAAADLLREVGKLTEASSVVPSSVVSRLRRVAPRPKPKSIEGTIIFPAPPGPPEVVLDDVVQLIPELSDMHRAARAAGKGGMAQSVGRLRSEAMMLLTNVAQNGDDAGLRALEALRYFSEDFRPRFGAREGKEFRRAWRINKSEPGHLRATETPRRFLKPSTFGGTPESAQQLKLILGGGPEGVGAVRKYLAASMADYIGSHPTAKRMAAWRDQWKNVFRAYPEIGKEVGATLRAFIKNKEATGEMAAALKEAVETQRQTERGIKSSALRFWTDINDPLAGVETIMKTTDPSRHMGDVVEMARRDKTGKAMQGLKDAMNDWLEQSVTNSSRNLVDEELTTSLAKVENLLGKPKMRAAISQLYSPDEMKTLDQVRRGLHILNRQNVQAVAGSITLEKMEANVQRARILMASIFGIVKGRGIFAITRWLGQVTGRDPVEMSRELLTRSLIDPELGKIMLSAPAEAASYGRLQAYVANNMLAETVAPESPEAVRKRQE